MKHLWTRTHALVYRLSGGRILGRFGGRPVLLLRTTGRRTGRRRTTPVEYLPAGAGYVVVAANAGAARPPAWSLNLGAEPRAGVRVRTQDVDVLARELHGSEREDMWRRLTSANPRLEDAARKAGRTLPVLLLAPAPRP